MKIYNKVFAHVFEKRFVIIILMGIVQKNQALLNYLVSRCCALVGEFGKWLAQFSISFIFIMNYI